MRIRVRAAVAGAAIAVVGLLAPKAEAKATYDSPYSYRQTFGSALRLVKVDLDLAVTETNADWGYFVFEYKSPEAGKQPRRGSFQFVESDGDVQVALDLNDMPSYHEQVIVDKLKRKLSDEHGDPPKRAPKKRPPKRAPKDGDDRDRPKDDPPADGDERDDDKRRDDDARRDDARRDDEGGQRKRGTTR